jgi:hypothetical protein
LHKRAGNDERGAALIEGAIMLPLFFLLLFGLLEFGFAFRDYLTLANGTRDGARTASTAGAQSNADYLTLTGIQEAMDAMPESEIERIVIFKADGPTDTVPTSCAGGTAQSGTEACNVYTTTSFDLAEDQFDCGGVGTAPDNFWCPTTRKTATAGANGPPDYLGVYIRVHYGYITGLFPGGGLTMDDTTIMRLEPRSVE